MGRDFEQAPARVQIPENDAAHQAPGSRPASIGRDRDRIDPERIGLGLPDPVPGGGVPQADRAVEPAGNDLAIPRYETGRTDGLTVAREAPQLLTACRAPDDDRAVGAGGQKPSSVVGKLQ